MTKLSNISRRCLALVALASLTSAAIAQNYYDDDIYYDASKAKKEQKKEISKRQSADTGRRSYIVSGNTAVGDYAPADTYTVPASSALNVDVDAYNRRGQFLVQDSVGAAADNDADFAYTQRI